jgi:hypothetical protein
VASMKELHDHMAVREAWAVLTGQSINQDLFP